MPVMGHQPSFRVISFDPSSVGLDAAVGDIAQLSGGGQAWMKLGTGLTDWTDVTALGSAGGGHADGVSIDGVGSVGSPYAVIPSYIEGLVAPTLPKAAANLTDAASTTINPAVSRVSVVTIPVATLSADNRILVLGVTGSPKADSIFQVVRRDLSAHPYLVKDDAGTTIGTFGASPTSPEGMSFRYNLANVHYEFLNFFYPEV